MPDRLAARQPGLSGERFGAGKAVERDEVTARRAPLPPQPPLQHQFTDRLPYGLPRDLVPLGQVPLGGEQSALAEFVDEGGDPRLHREYFGMRPCSGIPERTGAAGCWSFG